MPATSTLEPDDYRGANAALQTDRGHQAPLAAFTGTDHWRETNYLSNITPQSSGLNQGPWVRIETAARNLARQNAIYVMTGPLYEREMPDLPGADEAHQVPSGYWKTASMKPSGGPGWGTTSDDRRLPELESDDIGFLVWVSRAVN